MTTTYAAPTPLTSARTPGAGSKLTTLGLFIVLMGLALVVIDFFIVNVALPTIGTDLHVSPAALEMVVAGYGIAFALLLVLGGRLGDTFGHRRLFLAALVAFTLTSLACGLAQTSGMLVAARIAQGASAALLLPQVLSIIQATSSGERRSTLLGLYGATGGISVVIGQLLGGFLVAADLWGMGWRPIFLVNVPIGVVALALGRHLPQTRASNPAPIDWWGTLLLGATMFAFLIPLMEGRVLGWPTWTLALLALSPVTAVAFGRLQLRGERSGGVPLLPPSVVGMLSVRRGLAVGVPFYTGFGTFMFVITVTLQQGLGLGPLGSGAALTPMAVGFFTASLISSRLVARFGQRIVVAGAVLQLLGLLILITSISLAWPGLNVPALIAGMLLCGAGQGLIATTLTRVVLSRMPTELAGVGSGVMTTMQQTCQALGVATLGSLFMALAASTSLGQRMAFAVVIGTQALLTVGVVAAARRLPDLR